MRDGEPDDRPAYIEPANQLVEVNETSKGKPTGRQFEANRRNALKSTGPRSLAGKSRSRQNAVIHGLTSQSLSLLPGEDPALFLKFRGKMVNAYQPKLHIERELVDRLASLMWRLRRIPELEGALYRWTAYLEAAENEAGEAEWQDVIGDVGDPLAGADSDLADPLKFGRVIEVLLDSDKLSKLSRYSQSLQREVESTIKLLHDAQRSRREREAVPGYKPTVHMGREDEYVEFEGQVMRKLDPP